MSAATTLVIVVLASGLVAAAAWRLFRSHGLAATAAAIFITSPIVLTAAPADVALAAAMLASSAWLVAMLVSLERTDALAAGVAGAIAGLALYLRPASLVCMPLLIVCGAAGLLTRHPRPIALRQVGWLGGAFVVTALPMAVSIAADPSQLSQLILRYRLYDATTYNVLQGAREMGSWVGLVARSEAYWNYFDPALWFFSGSTLQQHLTDPRVFLAPVALPAALGVYRLAVPITAASWLVISCLAVAAVPSMLLARPIDQSRLLTAAPFVALTAAAGIALVVRWIRR